MTNYISILLTQDGVFCVAPPWTVKEGDLISLTDVLSGEERVREVIAVATQDKGDEFVNMIEKYIGYPMPKIKAKYSRREAEWNEPVHE